MSKHHLRHERTCLNCGHWIEERFCSRCGQENTDSRQTFRHLIGHFFEDLTHYEGKFWKTMKNLLFKPAFLSKQFLQGKRYSYVLPVRLYIFISFVTFLLPHILPEVEDPEVSIRASVLERRSDSLSEDLGVTVIDGNFGIEVPIHYRSVHELDSIQKSLPEDQRLGFLKYWIEKRFIHLHSKSPAEIWEKFNESFGRSFPKSLFIFMPLFALVLWLFHGKKRWLYFDHAIFTLHYFSFMLLLFDLISIVMTICDFTITNENAGFVAAMIGSFFLQISFILYFYFAHKNMYGESTLVSILKSTGILVIVVILFAVLLTTISIITVLNLH